MTVYKPKKSPHYHYDFVFKGNRYHGSTNCHAKRDADAYERRIRTEVANPSGNRPTITLDEACGLHGEKVRDTTSWPTERYILKALLAIGGKRLLSEISQRELQVHFAKRRNGRSNASVNREIDTARAVWRKAEKARFEIGEKRDWAGLYLKVAEKPPRELSEAEQDALFEQIPADAHDAVMFALISGWRKAEVIGLRWSDMDLQRAEAWTRVKGGDVVIRPLNPALVALIANQPKVGPFVFTYVCRQRKGAHVDKRGRKHPARAKDHRYPLTVTTLRTRFTEAKAAAELSGFRFHDLRHTAATRILRATQNLATTQKVLRHKNIKTTLRYAHVLDDDVRKALDAGQSRNIPEQANSSKRKS